MPKSESHVFPQYSHYRCAKAEPIKKFLKREAGLSSVRVDRLLEFGAIYVNGERVRALESVQSGAIVRVHFQPKRFAVPECVSIIFDDDDLLVIDKPAGLPTHPTLDNYLENAWWLTQKQLGIPLYVTHRLDIGTEGLLIFAKTKEAQAAINRLFEKRRVTKIYRALTEGPAPLGSHRHFMQVDEPAPKPVSLNEGANACSAVMNVLKVWPLPEQNAYACELELETGRTHQIRAQLGFLGCPILGDALYGSKRKFVHERFALECFHISFTHRSQTIGIYRPTPLVAPLSTKDS